MWKVFLVLILLIASFFGGIYFERLNPDEVGALNTRIAQLQQEINELTARNESLTETLQLVKRQIQTDRIAYQSLQDIIQASEQERTELKAQLESQRELLKKLRSRLEQSSE